MSHGDFIDTFQCWDGRLYTIPNFTLYSATIRNVRRSPPQFDLFPISIGSETPVEKIKALERMFLEYLKTRPEHFDAARSGLFVNEFMQSNSLTIQCIVAHVTNWQNAENYLRKHLCLLRLKEIGEELGIRYFPPVQRIAITDDVEFDTIPQPIRPAAVSPGVGTASPNPRVPLTPTSIKLQPVPPSKKFFSNFDM